MWLPNKGTLLRAFSAALAIIVLYLCKGFISRDWATDSLVWLSQRTGLQAVKVNQTIFQVSHHFYLVGLSCTALDVALGVIVFLLPIGKLRGGSWLSLALLTVAILIVNLLRIELGFHLYDAGVPWALAHSAISGLFYFLILLIVIRTTRRWRVDS